MAQISSLFVRKVISAASDSLNKPSLLREIGVDPDAPLDFDMLVSEERYYDLLQRLAETEAGPLEFHLRAGASMRCDEYGVLGLAWKSAPTLLESFRRAARYAELINGTRLYSVHEQEETVLIAMDREARSPGVRLSNEAAMASFLALAQDSVGRAFAPLAVHYRHGPPPGSASHYQQHFGCPVHFSSQFNALAVPRAVALEPNRLGDTAMSRFFEAQLDHKLAALQRDISFEQRVQSQISAALPTGVPKKRKSRANWGSATAPLTGDWRMKGCPSRDCWRNPGLRWPAACWNSPTIVWPKSPFSQAFPSKARSPGPSSAGMAKRHRLTGRTNSQATQAGGGALGQKLGMTCQAMGPSIALGCGEPAPAA
ncbi:hypothetical protein C8024_02165 [Sphingopyxis sp. BSNA05]|nr:AraC family transcriptional regulator [Sphingopyxis sp. BSNA05]NRD88525.1 hypothetical protein [Sphingopyxis sp. BSNA05]